MKRMFTRKQIQNIAEAVVNQNLGDIIEWASGLSEILYFSDEFNAYYLNTDSLVIDEDGHNLTSKINYSLDYLNQNAQIIDSTIINATLTSAPITETIQAQLDNMKKSFAIKYNGALYFPQYFSETNEGIVFVYGYVIPETSQEQLNIIVDKTNETITVTFEEL